MVSMLTVLRRLEDLLVQVMITVPATLSARERELYEELAKLKHN